MLRETGWDPAMLDDADRVSLADIADIAESWRIEAGTAGGEPRVSPPSSPSRLSTMDELKAFFGECRSAGLKGQR